MAYKRRREAFEADLQKQESPYVFYGTPLPPLDEHTRDDGSYVPVWQQEVKDDRGRKRLHGAFTGGFSAGYFNTVGSKEGWTPSTFVSSRQNRAKDAKIIPQLRPEDFMDEEDLREAEESRQLATSDGFTGFGTTEEDSKRRGAVMDIFHPTVDSIGIKLLKKMGWREGQGIGPKVRRKANLDDDRQEPGELHLFAPQNPTLISFVRNKDFKGLGYADEAGIRNELPVEVAHANTTRPDDEDVVNEPFSLLPKRAKSAQKSGLGVGILNDTGSDEDDPYEMGPKISYNKVIGGDKKPKKKKDISTGSSNPLLKEKPLFLSKKLLAGKGLSGFRKCHDGRLPLDGFVLSTELDSFASISLDGDSFKPPEVPPDWQSSKSANIENVGTTYSSTRDAAKASTLTAQSRAAILGETQLPSKSIFDFLTPAARERLALASGKTDLPVAHGEPLPQADHDQDPTVKSLHDLVPQLDSSVARQALDRGANGWMPYAEDETKLARYRAYLEIRASSNSEALEKLPPRATGMSTEDWAIEMQEFARAAQVFKPVTGLMASRFTSSTQNHTPGVDADTPPDLVSKPAPKPQDPAEVAARMGMFGPLTRSVQSWYPSRLLCKRFNVRVPDEIGPDPGEAPAGQSFPSGKHQYNETSEAKAAARTGEVKMLEAPPPAAPDQQARNAVVVDPDRNEALERERPGMAVFRAIFGSDDEDED